MEEESPPLPSIAEALFNEAALIFKENSPLYFQPAPRAGKTSTTCVNTAVLATVVDGGRGFCALTVCPVRGYMSFFPNKEGSTPLWLVRPLPPIIMERLWPPL